ncbi:MAG: hypothetical protein IKN45_07640, partial [Lachnospiraceae bacterium]|nr:hypothetical protein [Lachnospiraceae bacterium]
PSRGPHPGLGQFCDKSFAKLQSESNTNGSNHSFNIRLLRLGKEHTMKGIGLFTAGILTAVLLTLMPLSAMAKESVQ